MKPLLIILFCLLFSSMQAQPARDMTPDEVAFTNKISNALLNSIPKEFHDWDARIPEYKTAVAGETRCSNCNFGKDCFWNYGFHIVFDGTTQQGPDYDLLRDSLKKVPFDWHYVALMSRFTNTHSLTIELSVNDTELIGDFRYCPSGVKTMTPPPGFDHYYLASLSKCFPQDAKGFITDVNLYTMKVAPKITPHPQNGFIIGSLFFPLVTTTPLKIQELSLRIYGSKELASEFISKMNMDELKKIFN